MRGGGPPLLLAPPSPSYLPLPNHNQAQSSYNFNFGSQNQFLPSSQQQLFLPAPEPAFNLMNLIPWNYFTGNTSNKDLSGYLPSPIINSTADLLALIIKKGCAISESQKDIFGNFIYTLENSTSKDGSNKYRLTSDEDLLLREKLKDPEIPKKLEILQTDPQEVSIEEINLEISTTTNISSTNLTSQLVTPITTEQILVNQINDDVILTINPVIPTTTTTENPPQIRKKEKEKEEKEKEEKEEKENSYTDFFSFAAGALSTAVLGSIGKIISNPPEPLATSPKTTSTKPTNVESIHDVIAKINKNSEHDSLTGSKNHQARHWYNNKKLVKVLEKIAGSTFENNFEGLKKALNSADNQKNADIKLLELNIGDLSILDAIDNLDVTRAGNSIKEISHSRENLKTMISLIPKDKRTREEFFKIPRDKNFDLKIITPNNNPKNPNASQFLQKVVKIH